jgi:hypothetical protein
MSCEPRFEYGSQAAVWREDGFGEAAAEAAGQELALNTDLDLTLGQGTAEGSIHLKEGESCFCTLAWGRGIDSRPRSAPEATERVDARRSSPGVSGWSRAASPTIRGAFTCSARPSC